MAFRVIVWGTGFVGKMVIRELASHPQFELAGVIVNDPAKDGKDAGEIAGIGPIGVTASRDSGAVLSAGADALAYFGPTAAFAKENIANMSQAMRAGMDVVSTSMTPLVYPPACPPGIVEELEQVCQETGKSCFTTGIDPGFANDLIPMTLMGLTGRVDRIRIQEILDYSTYAGDYAGPMGLGEPMEFQAMLENRNVLIFSWGHTVPMIADAIGADLEKIDTTWEKWAATERITFPLGQVEKGHCAAIRFEIRGWVDGEPRIVVEHVNRLTHAAAPDWPRPSMVEDDAYRVIVEGSPNIEQETAFRGAYDGDPNSGGCLANGMRAVNAIPAVVSARPGLLSALDIPLVPGTGVMHRAK
jgi:4-hydroxy-tetrahydrodipicolinate reductase